MSLEEEEEARTIDVHQKAALALGRRGTRASRRRVVSKSHRGPRVGKRESSLTLFRIVKKLFFPSKTLMKQETTLKTRETVANMLQREEDVKANDPEMITIPSSIRGDYSLLWLRNLLKEHEHESETTLDRDVVGAHVKNMCESFVYVSEDKE